MKILSATIALALAASTCVGEFSQSLSAPEPARTSADAPGVWLLAAPMQDQALVPSGERTRGPEEFIDDLAYQDAMADVQLIHLARAACCAGRTEAQQRRDGLRQWIAQSDLNR